MRVLLIDVNCKYSSTGKIVYSLYQAARANGDEAAICYGRGLLINEENIYRFSPLAEVYVHALLTRITGLTGCFSPLATRNLIRYMEQYRPDVVHIHELHAYFVNLAPIISYLKEKHIPTVWTFHCEFMYTGKCGYSYECEKWKTGCGHCPRLKDYPSSLLFDKTHRMWEQKKYLLKDLDFSIAVPSKWVADRVKKSFLQDKPVQVIYNGLDTDTFHYYSSEELRNQLHMKGQKIVVHITPDFYSAVKGGQHVIRMAKQFPDVIFFIIGSEAKGNDIPENCFFIGRIANQNLLAQYYALGDVCLLTSVRETFSMVCAESLCCGTPVVGFKSGGPETIALPEYSVFVDQGNDEALAVAMRDMLQKSYDKKAISNRAVAVYGQEIMCQNYRDLYYSIL